MYTLLSLFGVDLLLVHKGLLLPVASSKANRPSSGGHSPVVQIAARFRLLDS